MKRNDAVALRILSTAITALLVLAAWRSQGPFWMSFVLGAACGLSIAVLVIVWQKELHWMDEKIYPAPTELGLRGPNHEP